MQALNILLRYLASLILIPLAWLLRKLRLVPGTPPEIVLLVDHLARNELRPAVSIRPERINDVQTLAWLVFQSSDETMAVVTLAACESQDLAVRVEEEMLGAPQYTGVQRNGPYVIGCTFMPPNPELQSQVGASFSSFASAT